MLRYQPAKVRLGRQGRHVTAARFVLAISDSSILVTLSIGYLANILVQSLGVTRLGDDRVGRLAKALPLPDQQCSQLPRSTPSVKYSTKHFPCLSDRPGGYDLSMCESLGKILTAFDVIVLPPGKVRFTSQGHRQSSKLSLSHKIESRL